MVTKGVIISKIEGTNKFNVRVPIFENVGNSSVLDDPKSPAYAAAVCYTPGMLENYLPGDIVYITFENNELDNLIIIGKLYQGEDVGNVGFAKIDKLEVGSDTELNGNVRVNGVMLSTLNDHNQAISNIQNFIKNQSNKNNKMGDWVIEADKNNLVLNFYREKGEA